MSNILRLKDVLGSYELRDLRAQKVVHWVSWMKSVQPEIRVDWHTAGWIKVRQSRCSTRVGEFHLERGFIGITVLLVLRVSRAVACCVEISRSLHELLGVVENSGEEPVSIEEEQGCVWIAGAQIVDQSTEPKVELCNVGGLSSLTQRTCFQRSW